MNREVLLITPGAGDDDEAVARRAVIEPHFTAADLLRLAGLSPDEWQIQIRQGQGMAALAAGDKLFECVNSGDKLFAFPTDVVVGHTT